MKRGKRVILKRPEKRPRPYSAVFMKVILYTFFALSAFAFNSILCRMALGDGEIDATSFTGIRLASGAITLAVIVAVVGKNRNFVKSGNWLSALFLFAYAICFSFAYNSLTTAAGALILFGAVQFTMISVALVRGEKLWIVDWLGILMAFAGFIHLVLPRLDSPSLAGAALMAAAGVAWGFYTLRGKGSENPLGETAGNFSLSLPMMAVASLPFWGNLNISPRGAVIAAVSGAIASGIGYAVWYAALRYHSTTRAAVLQLAVPVIAAFGGVVWLNEKAGAQLVAASSLILGGIALTNIRKNSVPAITGETL